MPRKSWVAELPPDMENDPNMKLVNKLANEFERVALETLGCEDYTELSLLQGKQIMGALSVSLFNAAPALGISADSLVELVGRCMSHVLEDDDDANGWN